ncbi:WD40-repeat-containing domain protein [Plectosphaerella plurivora]|uniref:WD40-repeat-containing domain protein n=1 Tax=Plectosphaerella plurivora TaxID=936078 RepID=A0A9P8VCC4_9PEZI|nr:WD40-repeat-containing domain protein [Plectosphaerella plurivora]
MYHHSHQATTARLLQQPDGLSSTHQVRLDRFVPQRDHATPPNHKYRTTKSISELTTSERLLRNARGTLDAFRADETPPRTPVEVHVAAVRGGIPGKFQSTSCWSARFSNQKKAGTAPIPALRNGERQLSHGTSWSVGGLAPPSTAVDDGHGRLIQSGTNARVYSGKFPDPGPTFEFERHESRLATALDIDQASKILEVSSRSSTSSQPNSDQTRRRPRAQRTTWNGTEWVNHDLRRGRAQISERKISPVPFRCLDAIGLRDDYYCSALAYAPDINVLAVGMGSCLYLWSERTGYELLSSSGFGSWITSASFSSLNGSKAILAFGQSNGKIGLMTTDGDMRFQIQHTLPINYLLVGNQQGGVHYYIVEWAEKWEVSRDGWPGSATLVANISAHTAQICALVWSPNGHEFATGGDDDLCCLFDTHKVLNPSRPRPRCESSATVVHHRDPTDTSTNAVCQITRAQARHCWLHRAAIKAIAFCPWQEGLLATGGGSNDQCIHFFHTRTGTPLATINVGAQVTSLIWSTTRREIAATFGYAQPDHSFRIAEGGPRALCAVGYPSPVAEHQASVPKEFRDSSLVVASSDEQIRFHEVWKPNMRSAVGGAGMLAGSDVLESLEGIHKEGDIIR